MQKEDSFLRKLQPLSDLPRLMDKRSRFANYNEKTMGFILVNKFQALKLRKVAIVRFNIKLKKKYPKKSVIYLLRIKVLK